MAPKVFGITVVRDDVDVVAACLQHQLSIGIDRIIVMDHESRDGTERVLRRLAARLPIDVTHGSGPFRQSDFLTGLAHEARGQGADWIVPFDADEFWAPLDRRLKEVLGHAQSSAVRVRLINFVQRRSRRRRSPYGLLTMTRRPPAFADSVAGMDAVKRGEIATVEIEWPSKVAFRPTADMVVAKGAHSVSGLDGPEETTPHIEVLHALLRSRQDIDQRVERGLRERPHIRGNDSWHLQRMADLDREACELEWRAGSYGRDGMLDVHGNAHPLIEDTRLRDAVAPWVMPVRKTRARRILATAVAAG